MIGRWRRSLLAYYFDGKNGSAAWVLFALAMLLSVLVWSGAGLWPFAPEATSATLDFRSAALKRARREWFPTPSPVASDDQTSPCDPDVLVQAAEEDNLRKLVENRFAELQRRPACLKTTFNPEQWSNPDFKQWLDESFCPIRGWDRDSDKVRVLVINGVGECGLSQRIAARSWLLRLVGAWWGIIILLIAAFLAFGAWRTALLANQRREAYIWLYRSKVF